MSEKIQTMSQKDLMLRKDRRRAILQFIAKYGTIIGMFLMIGIFSALRPNSFFRFNNFVNIVNQASLTAIISGGLTVALIVAEMDLSIACAACRRSYWIHQQSSCDQIEGEFRHCNTGNRDCDCGVEFRILSGCPNCCWCAKKLHQYCLRKNCWDT